MVYHSLCLVQIFLKNTVGEFIWEPLPCNRTWPRGLTPDTEVKLTHRGAEGGGGAVGLVEMRIGWSHGEREREVFLFICLRWCVYFPYGHIHVNPLSGEYVLFCQGSLGKSRFEVIWVIWAGLWDLRRFTRILHRPSQTWSFNSFSSPDFSGCFLGSCCFLGGDLEFPEIDVLSGSTLLRHDFR